MPEEWRDIEGFEGKYQVSNLGRVRNIKFVGHARSFKQERVLTPKVTRYGYLSVHLSKGKDKDFHPSIHRLVAQAFIPNPDNLPEVNHKDEDKRNNRADNLEWCTTQYNTAYGTGQQRAHDANKKPVLQLDKDTGEIVAEYPGAVDASVALFGTKNKKNGITSCARGERPRIYGFVWKYKEDVIASGK